MFQLNYSYLEKSKLYSSIEGLLYFLAFRVHASLILVFLLQPYLFYNESCLFATIECPLCLTFL